MKLTEGTRIRKAMAIHEDNKTYRSTNIRKAIAMRWR